MVCTSIIKYSTVRIEISAWRCCKGSRAGGQLELGWLAVSQVSKYMDL